MVVILYELHRYVDENLQRNGDRGLEKSTASMWKFQGSRISEYEIDSILAATVMPCTATVKTFKASIRLNDVFDAPAPSKRHLGY